MTTQQIINYYADLLVLQYKGKPKAYATVQALVALVIADQLPMSVQEAYTLGTAVGVQLDIIGKYAGVTRNGYALDGSPITLDDSDFTAFILFAIIKNNNGSSLYDIQKLLHMFFPGEIFVFDYANMHMNYYLSPLVGSFQLAELFVTQKMFPKPMGVQLGSIIYSLHIADFFGFRTYLLPPNNATPFNNYTDGFNPNWFWLSYTDALTL